MHTVCIVNRDGTVARLTCATREDAERRFYAAIAAGAFYADFTSNEGLHDGAPLNRCNAYTSED